MMLETRVNDYISGILSLDMYSFIYLQGYIRYHQQKARSFTISPIATSGIINKY